MDPNSTNEQKLCVANCGFFGSPSLEGLCSVCHKKGLQKRQTEIIQSTSSDPSINPADDAPTIDTGASCSKEEEKLQKTDNKPMKVMKPKKHRCQVCRKKVGLTGFECRCGGLFCGVHRYSDKHDCDFNYREMAARELRRNNPLVVADKIEKI